MKTKDIVLVGMLAALLLVAQVALAFLPNIELVSILIIIYTLHFKKKALFTIYVFALLEGVIFGFGLWWFMYLYVWTVLYLITRFFKETDSNIFWAIISGLFGLMFGALCSIPYLFIGGFPLAITYWLSGIPWDLVHCIGNFFVALFLYKPINYIFLQFNQNRINVL